MIPVPAPVLPGQVSVWDFPRPAIVEPCDRHLRIVHRGVVVADTVRAVRTLETSHPPGYYVPPADITLDLLRPAPGRRSLCEWKGQARYWDVVVDGVVLPRVAWSYPDPTPAFRILAGYIAFYAGPFDGCTVDGAPVEPQPGGFYGGWITPDLAGPFKGAPGTTGW